RRDPEHAGPVLDRWASDGDFWVRRAAILAELKPLRAGAAFDRFARPADAMIDERELFIRKAIGRVLRETGKRRAPEEVAWLVAVTSAHLTTTTVNATISRDASLAELFVNENLRPNDLIPRGADSSRQAELDGKLASLTRNDQILRVDIRAPDGEVLFASLPS